MKSKIRVNKNDNTTVVEYFKVNKPFEFRYKMISKMLKPYDEALMFIDTNSRTKKPEKRMEAYFDENNIEYSMFKISETEKKVFGLVMNIFRKPTPKMTEKFVIAKIDSKMFSKEFYDDYVSTYDIALGFGSKLSIQGMIDDYRENVQDLYFSKDYFEEFLYDSIIFACLRSTINVSNYVAECE